MNTAEEYRELFQSMRKKHFSVENVKQVSKEYFHTEFEIDEHNSEVVDKLLEYFSGLTTSKLCQNKGVMLIGGIGTGKTLLMSVMCTIAYTFKEAIIGSEFNSIYKLSDDYVQANNYLNGYVEDLDYYAKSEKGREVLLETTQRHQATLYDNQEFYDIAKTSKDILKRISLSVSGIYSGSRIVRAFCIHKHKTFKKQKFSFNPTKQFFYEKSDMHENEEIITSPLDDDYISYISTSLCIDDLGVEPQYTMDYGEKVFLMLEILYERYDFRHQFKTHFTTNKNVNEIEELYGVRVRDRLREMVTPLVLKGESRRK